MHHLFNLLSVATAAVTICGCSSRTEEPISVSQQIDRQSFLHLSTVSRRNRHQIQKLSDYPCTDSCRFTQKKLRKKIFTGSAQFL